MISFLTTDFLVTVLSPMTQRNLTAIMFSEMMSTFRSATLFMFISSSGLNRLSLWVIP